MDREQTTYDDLTIIKGIGLTRQEWLRHVFQIRTYADLAALAPEQIEARLKAERQIASRTEIAAWISKAQELAVPMASTPAAEHTAENKCVEASPPLPSDWQASARFVVEFQTSVDEAIGMREQLYRTVANHLDLATDHLLNSRSWPGLESAPLCTWMVEQAEKQTLPPPVSVRPSVSKPVLLPAQLLITQVQLQQPSQGQTASALYSTDRGMQGVITGGEPFTLLVSFDLAGAMATDLVQKQARYHAQAYLFNLATGGMDWGASTPAALDAKMGAYTAHLSCPALAPGIYRLRIVLTLASKPPLVDYLELALLQVV